MSAARLYFMVAPDDESLWRVSTREDEVWMAPVRYATCHDAVDAAVRLARAEHTATGRATGVRVRHGPQDWCTSHTFGHEPPALFTPVV